MIWSTVRIRYGSDFAPVPAAKTERFGLVSQPTEHKGEGSCSQNGGDHQKHGVQCEQTFVSFHVLKIVQQVGVSAIQGDAEQKLASQSDQVGLILHSGFQLYRQRDLLLGGGIDDLLCFGKTEPVTEGKDAAVENGEQKIPPGLISLAKQSNQAG